MTSFVFAEMMNSESYPVLLAQLCWLIFFLIKRFWLSLTALNMTQQKMEIIAFTIAKSSIMSAEEVKSCDKNTYENIYKLLRYRRRYIKKM